MPKHFLHLSDYTSDELWDLLKLAKELKTKFKNKETYKPFDGRSLAMISLNLQLEHVFLLKLVLNGWVVMLYF